MRLLLSLELNFTDRAKKRARRYYMDDESSEDNNDEDDGAVEDGDGEQSTASSMHDVGRVEASDNTDTDIVKHRESTASIESSLFVDAEPERAIEEVSVWGNESDSDATMS